MLSLRTQAPTLRRYLSRSLGFIALLVLLCNGGHALAQEDACELQQLIDEATAGGTVELEGRIYECPTTIVIKDRKGFTLRGQEGTEIVCMDPQVSVVYVADSPYVKLENLFLRHGARPGGCGGRVLSISQCDTTTLTNCVFDGCGVVGIYARAMQGLTVKNCILRNNSSDGFWFEDVQNVSFVDVAVHSNGEPFYGDMPGVFTCIGVTLEGRPYDFHDKSVQAAVEFASTSKYDPLWKAVLGGDVEEVRSQLSEVTSDSVNEPREGMPLLHLAIRERHLDIASLLLEAGALPESRDLTFDASALDYAIISRQFSMVPTLMAKGADPYRCNRMPFCAVVAMQWDKPMREALLAGGLEDESLLRDPRSAPLFIALESGDHTRALKLIADGVNLATRIGDDQALHVAAAYGHTPVIKALVEAGASTTRFSKYGQTPTSIAFFHNHVEAGLYLLSAQGDLDLRDSNGGNLLTNANSLQRMRLLMDNGVPMDVVSKGSFGITFLHRAARFGDLALTRRALEAGAPIDRTSTYGSALSRAAMFGHIEVLNLLIEAGANVEVADWTRVSPIIQAAESGHLECVKALLKAGADFQKVNDKGKSPVQLAAQGGFGEVAAVLLEVGASFYGENGGDNSLLTAAASSGLDALVTRLLDFGCAVNGVDQHGWSALHAAAAGGHGSTVRLLVERGATLEAVGGSRKRTPLEAAISTSGNGESIIALRALGSKLDPQRRDEYKNTPLHLAAASGYLNIINELIGAGADVNATNARPFGEGRPHNTPLHLAADSGKTNAVAMLLQAGAHVNSINDSDQTPLSVCPGAFDSLTSEMLIRGGANIELGGAESMPPLLEAVRWGKEYKLRVLLAAGADVNATHGGNTALHIAAHAEQWEAAAWLLDAGADSSLKNSDGKTAFDVAVEKGNLLYAHVLTPAPQEALIAAIKSLDLSALQAALDQGANPSLLMPDGLTPLHHLARKRSRGLPAARVLIAAGADPNALDSRGNTPLSIVVEREAGREFILALLAAGGNPAAGRTPALQLAKSQGNEALLQDLSDAKNHGTPKVPVLGRSGFPHPAQQAAQAATRETGIKALKLLDCALRLKPRDGQYRLLRARARNSAGDTEGALEDYQAIAEDKPNGFEARFEYGVLLAATGKEAKALAHFNHILFNINGTPNLQLHLARGRAYAGLGRHKEAATDFALCNQLAPKTGETLRLLGQSQHALGLTDQACQSWSGAASVGDKEAEELKAQHCL